jgi:hypothetical protein
MEVSLSDWASIAEILGAIVVTVSLVFVGLEVRRNTVATKAATLQDSVGYDVRILVAVGASAEASKALWNYSFRRDRMNEDQLIQARWLFASTVRHWENIYLQYLAGTLSEDAWRAREPALRVLVLSPGWDDYVDSELGAFMGGPFMEFARDVRSSAEAETPTET